MPAAPPRHANFPFWCFDESAVAPHAAAECPFVDPKENRAQNKNVLVVSFDGHGFGEGIRTSA
jgi:hypothetical protein